MPDTATNLLANTVTPEADTRSELLAMADRLIALALRRGAAEAEAYASNQRTRAAHAVRDEIQWFRDADVNGVGLRVVRHGRIGYAYCSMSQGRPMLTAEVLVDEALDLAAVTRPQGRQGPLLPDRGRPAVDVPGLHYDRATRWDVAETAEAMAELAAAALAVPGVIDVPRNHYGTEQAHTAVVNSHGLRSSFGSTIRYQWAETIAVSAGGTVTGNDAGWTRGDADLDPRAIGTRAGEYARRHAGATPVPSGDYAVVLTPQAAVNLVSRLGMLLTADAFEQGRTLFELGAGVAAPAFSLVDDATIPGGLGSQPVDAEGVPTRRTTLIDRGTVTGVLHDSATAATFGHDAAPGNAKRSSYRAMPHPGPSNLFINPGTVSPSSLVAGVSHGILVDELIGLHATNPVTGRFGAAARGRLIRGGRIDRPVADIAIAGRYSDLLTGICGIADDLTFLPGHSGLGSPSVLIDRLSVSGSSGGVR